MVDCVYRLKSISRSIQIKNITIINPREKLSYNHFFPSGKVKLKHVLFLKNPI